MSEEGIIFYKDTNKSLKLNYFDEEGTVNLTSHTISVSFFDRESKRKHLELTEVDGVTLGSTDPNIVCAFTVDQINALPKNGVITVDITISDETERILTSDYVVSLF